MNGKILKLYVTNEPQSKQVKMGIRGLPLQMQYLGSKARISEWIVTEIKKAFPECNSFYDIFSGTGIVAVEALSNGYKVSANDFEQYSYCILQSLLTLPKKGLGNVVNQLSNLQDEKILLSGGRFFMKELLEQEKYYFQVANQADFPWKTYKEFCDKTPIIEGTSKEIDRLRREGKWNLFSHYYANTYFGIKQCLQLDTLREFAEKHKKYIRNHLLAATMSAMTFGVSSTTHLAQYLRPSSRLRAIHLIKRRQFDLISEVKNRLLQLITLDLPGHKPRVYNLDYVSALQQEDLNGEWIVYVDPPYFKEHYSRYYHILNTFYLYDYPYLTFNRITKKVTQGRYRLNRNISDFGKKRSVENAFLKLFNSCKQKKFKLVLSYAETSLVKKDLLLKLSEEAGLNYMISENTLIHSSQGKSGGKAVTEYLFFFNLKEANKEWIEL